MLSFTKLNLLYLTTFYAPNFVCFFSFIIAMYLDCGGDYTSTCDKITLNNIHIS